MWEPYEEMFQGLFPLVSSVVAQKNLKAWVLNIFQALLDRQAAVINPKSSEPVGQKLQLKSRKLIYISSLLCLAFSL